MKRAAFIVAATLAVVATIASGGGGADGGPTIVGAHPESQQTSNGSFWRCWSDGQVDRVFYEDDGDTLRIEMYFPPITDGRVIDFNKFQAGAKFTQVLEDGRIRLLSCCPTRETIIDGSASPACPSDTDRNGVMDTADLVNVISGWGPCGWGGSARWRRSKNDS